MRLILILLILTVSSLHAQELKFELSKKMKELPYGNYKFFNRALKRTYVVRTPDDSRVAVAENYINYDPSFKSFAWETFVGKEAKILEGFYSVDTKNYIVYSEFNRKSRVQNVYTQELDDDMVILGSPIPITTFRDVKNENRTIVLGEKYIPYGNVRLIKSIHSDNLVIMKIRDGIIDAVAFNPRTGVLWSQAFQVDEENTINISAVEINQEGDFYVAGYYSKEPLMSTMGVTLGTFLLQYSVSQKKYQVHTLDDKDKIEDRGYSLSMLRNGTTVAVGMYNDKKKDKIGYKIFSFDPATLNLITVATAEFSDDFNKAINRGLYDIDFFATTNIEQLDNGSIIVAFAGGLSRSGKYTTTTYSTPVNVIAVSEKGEQQWSTLVNKYQTQPQGDDYIGHSLITQGNLVYVIYNDHIANLNLDPTKQPKEWILKDRNTLVTAVRIDEQGVARKTYPFGTSKTEKLIMDTDETRRVEERLYYFVLKSGDMGQLATLSTEP